ncbi:MAG: hypothetical protein WD734_03930 [Dehalococcoidia bacterium]
MGIAGHRRILGWSVITLALALAAAVYAAPAIAADASVAAVGTSPADSRFEPNVSTVNVGDTVTFTWDSGFHTATDVDGAFDIELTSNATSGTWTPTEPGTFYYYCVIHAAASDATEERVQANDVMAGKVVVEAAQATPTATPMTTPEPTPAETPPPAADFEAFGYPTVGASVTIPAGQGTTVTAGDQSVVVDPDTFDTDVVFDLLVAEPSTFQSFAPEGDRVLAAFAFRVRGPDGLIRSFSKPVHYTLTHPEVTADSQVYNTTATDPITAFLNTTPPVVTGTTHAHDYGGAGVGWFVTAGTSAAPPAPAATGTGGVSAPSSAPAALLAAAALAAIAVGGARLATRHRR